MRIDPFNLSEDGSLSPMAPAQDCIHDTKSRGWAPKLFCLCPPPDDLYQLVYITFLTYISFDNDLIPFLQTST